MKIFDTKKELEVALCASIVERIETAIALFGDCRILLSGGSTPIDLFDLLSQQVISWENVYIGLVDERYVAPSDDFSNEKMVRNQLLKNNAYAANFVGMVMDESDEEQNRVQVEKAYFPFFQRVDLVLLGMGEDGHTASLFPTDPASESDLISKHVGIISTRAPKYPEQRISCSKQALLQSGMLYLMLVGEKKLAAFDWAIAEKLPISHFNTPQLNVYYSKN
jgi:6-phosphogluconolactonase